MEEHQCVLLCTLGMSDTIALQTNPQQHTGRHWKMLFTLEICLLPPPAHKEAGPLRASDLRIASTQIIFWS